jgi:hypothetical protein
MNDKKIKDILQILAQEHIPQDVQKITEETLRNFNETLLPQRRLMLWEKIMRSSFIKLAAAAVIIIAVGFGVWLFVEGSTSVALADVLQKVEQAQAFMYKMKMKTKGNMQPAMPGGPMEMTGTVLISNEYGMKMEMDMNTVVNGASQKTRQLMYMLPQEKKAYMIMPEQKQYIQMEFTEDLLAGMKKQSNDPRDMLKRILNSKYTDIGKSVIDGVEVEGFQTTDPALGGGMMEEVTLWVDRKTELPVREEMHYKINEQMQMEMVLEDFVWNLQVNVGEFNPVIPQDYTNPLPNYKMPTVSEEGAIDGLKFCEQLMGRYPKKIDMMNLTQEYAAFMQEFMAIKDSNTDAALKLKEKIKATLKFEEELKEEWDKLPEEEKAKKRLEKTMDMMRPVQSLGMFYMTLVQGKKEPVYYGDKVAAADSNTVLMRWKISDDEYRVIYSDLTAENVSAEKLAELEAAISK